MNHSLTGLTHTDRELERRITNFLSQQHVPDMRKLEVNASQGVITIRGRVPSYHVRQLCINCCQRVAGVVRLMDEIEVAPKAMAV